MNLNNIVKISKCMRDGNNYVSGWRHRKKNPTTHSTRTFWPESLCEMFNFKVRFLVVFCIFSKFLLNFAKSVHVYVYMNPEYLSLLCTLGQNIIFEIGHFRGIILSRANISSVNIFPFPFKLWTIYFRLELEIEPVFVSMALYDGGVKKKVRLYIVQCVSHTQLI